MGRRPDDPARQAAKGYPGKRRARTDKVAADQAARVKMLAGAQPASRDPFAPPVLLNSRQFARELQVWNEVVPLLRARNLLDPLDRNTLSMFVVYFADWERATTDIRKHGATREVKTVSGDAMLRLNPSVHLQKLCADMIDKMSAKFGFTPADRWKITKDQQAVSAQAATLFGPLREAEPESAPIAQPAIGLMDRLDGTPPTLQ